MDGSPD